MRILAIANNFTINLEAVGIFLGILVSISILLGVLIQYSTKITKLETKVQYLSQELSEHSKLEGHKVLIEKLGRSTENVSRVEKSLDLHIQDYINRKDFIQFMLGQLDQKIDHKFGRLYSSIKDIEKCLQKRGEFRVREYFIEEEGKERE